MEPPQINKNYTPFKVPSIKPKEEEHLPQTPYKMKNPFSRWPIILPIVVLLFLGYHYRFLLASLSYSPNSFLWETWRPKKLNYTVAYPFNKYEINYNAPVAKGIFQLVKKDDTLTINIVQGFDVVSGCVANKICNVKSEQDLVVNKIPMKKYHTVVILTKENSPPSKQDTIDLTKYYNKPKDTVVYVMHHPQTQATVSAQLVQATLNQNGMYSQISEEDQALFDKIMTTFTFK